MRSSCLQTQHYDRLEIDIFDTIFTVEWAIFFIVGCHSSYHLSSFSLIFSCLQQGACLQHTFYFLVYLLSTNPYVWPTPRGQADSKEPCLQNTSRYNSYDRALFDIFDTILYQQNTPKIITHFKIPTVIPDRSSGVYGPLYNHLLHDKLAN